MTDDHAALIAEARNETACICPDLLDGPSRGCGEHGDEHSRLFARVIDALEAVQQTPAVDREALVEVLKFIPGILWLGATDSGYYADFADRMIELASRSGILQDAAVVKAEALEKFARQCDDDWGEFAYCDASGMIGYATVPEMANERAQQLRESGNSNPETHDSEKGA